MKRRNLSGIYIFEKFDNELKKQPTCFEDCKEETQNEYLESLKREQLIIMVKKLGQTIKNIGDQFDLMRD